MARPETVRARISHGGLSLRPATLDDAAFAADMETALFPDEPEDPAMMRHWWASDDPEWTTERFIVEERSRPIGFAHQSHAPWQKMPKGYGWVGGDILPELRTRERLTAIFDVVEKRSREHGTKIFSARAREDDQFRQRFLTDRHYQEERRTKGWELDLVKHRDHLLAMTESSRAKMRQGGIVILTLDRDRDSEKFRKIWRMNNEAFQDIPTTVPIVPDPFEIFMKWFESPGLREDRIWIARSDGDVVGISMLAYPPTRGNVWTSFTGTARSVRGKGVARALKCETVAQAIALGVRRVRTENDGRNAPILHLNEEMGYERIPGRIEYLKPA
jgi:hypothetical protein